MGKAAASIEPGHAERRELESLARGQKAGHATARRSCIVLAAAAGLENKVNRINVGIGTDIIGYWRCCFAVHRLDGLLDEPRPGTPRRRGDDAIADTIRLTRETTPSGATHGLLRSMAKAVGYVPSTIHRLRHASRLQPHQRETFKLSTDPLILEKLGDVGGPYPAPPEQMLVLCVEPRNSPDVDEKSQIQALDRTQLLSSTRRGQVERNTIDYTCYGTASLFAALDVATGAVIARRCLKHHLSEFRSFLDQIEAAVPAGADICLAMDSHSTHRTRLIRDRLVRQPHWHVHLTPISASWTNPVERFVALITERQVRRDIHCSTQALEAGDRVFVDARNTELRPFRRIKSVDKFQRFGTKTQQIFFQTRQVTVTTELGH